jgi:hypothetical protein
VPIDCHDDRSLVEGYPAPLISSGRLRSVIAGSRSSSPA